jgi:hypothetical protein
MGDGPHKGKKTTLYTSFWIYYYYYYCPCYHLYARYVQLYTPNKRCFYGIQCCSCSVFTVCAICNVISTVKCVLYLYISTSRSLCAVHNTAVFCSSLILLLLLLLLLLLSLSSPLRTEFTIIYPKHPLSIRYTVLQLFCIYSLRYM